MGGKKARKVWFQFLNQSSALQYSLTVEVSCRSRPTEQFIALFLMAKNAY